MRIVMPLFDFDYDSSEEFVFEGGKYALRRFNPDDEIPNTDLFSKLDVEYMKDECWALVAQDPDTDKYKQEVNILLLSFKIYKLSRLFIKYRLCKDNPENCSTITETMKLVLPEESNGLITFEDLKIVNEGFLNLSRMDTVSYRTHNAIYFMYRGFLSEKMIDSFAFLMMAIESLFSDEKRHGMTETICSRVSGFLGCKPRCKREDINRLYDLRSKIVHGKVVVDDDIRGKPCVLYDLQYVAIECVKKMLDENIYPIYEDVDEKENYFAELVKRELENP